MNLTFRTSDLGGFLPFQELSFSDFDSINMNWNNESFVSKRKAEIIEKMKQHMIEFQNTDALTDLDVGF